MKYDKTLLLEKSRLPASTSFQGQKVPKFAQCRLLRRLGQS